MPQIPALLKSGPPATKKTVEGTGTDMKVNINSRICALLLPKKDVSVHINKLAEQSANENINLGEI